MAVVKPSCHGDCDKQPIQKIIQAFSVGWLLVLLHISIVNGIAAYITSIAAYAIQSLKQWTSQKILNAM